MFTAIKWATFIIGVTKICLLLWKTMYWHHFTLNLMCLL